MRVKAFAARKAKGPLKPFRFSLGRLDPREVEIEVTHCGICHSDVHLVDDDWGLSAFPLVPGHEAVGRVVRAGGAVRGLAKGDRVGVGWQSGSCGVCDRCVAGDENLCAGQEATAARGRGGFAERLRVDHRFAFKIPDAIPSENAGPLMCGGATVYAPLAVYGVRPPHRVGIVGVGGLGHLAIQFARAWGCEVTAFSTTPDKEPEARELGAHRFVDLGREKALAPLEGALDFVLSTAPAGLDWEGFVETLRPDGKLCLVGASPEPVSVPAFALLAGRKSVCGSPIGGRRLIREMLEFAARHGVRAKAETVPLSEADWALERTRRGEARYRMVLTV